MTSALAKLLEISSIPLAEPHIDWPVNREWLNAVDREILQKKNGFFAFESALHVFSSSTVEASWGIDEWNSRSLWKSDYGGLADDIVCFSEDIFGGQFCIGVSGISRFDPETGDLDPIAHDLEGWAAKILEDYDGTTGYGTAHAWQATYGLLQPQFRLMPKRPFVVGGTSDLANLVAINSVRLMKNMGNLAQQIHDLPDGSQIEFKVIY